MANRETEIFVEIKTETDKAYLASDGDVTEWIPKSQVSHFEEKPDGHAELTIPEWLATEKGFV